MKTAEQEAVLRSVRKLIDFWQIEAHELSGIPEPVAQPVVSREPSGPKYRHPITAQTWDGEGAQPPWLREALTREGYTVQELRLKDDETSGA
nr:H-NS family nucleoid-associated regulatory protein [uncultured Aquabacterium sp.]